ncbi:MAG: sensor histidine kinase [Bacteroidia bacterium]|nr:sensor histidine kinase [Bacteroidia bacterium]
MFENTRNRPFFRLSIHLFIWVFLLMFPYLLSSNESPDLIRLLKFTWIPLFFSAIIFYINYLWLIDEFLVKKRLWSFTGINLLITAVLVLIHLQIRDFLNARYVTAATLPKPWPTEYFVYKDTISMLIPMIIAIATRATEKWASAESKKKEQEKNVLHNELMNLKYQLQPHFFFNSLNTIYALIEKSPTMAQETVHGLSKLMRYILYETNTATTKLKNDVDFMKEYIRLMKLRTAEKTEVSSSFTVINDAVEVSPLLFISLIENAFKHGISATQGSTIRFELKQSGNKVAFTSSNTSFPKNENDKSGSGIGLVNLKKRLDLLYPGKHVFETRLDGNNFIARIEISTE